MMNQSTSFAQVATNLLNVLQGYTKTIRLLLVMFIALTVSAEVWAETITDEITASDLTATGTTYTDFSNVSKSSDAIYAGQSAKDNSGNIQLRSKNSNSGIVSTTSGGKVKSVKITVGSGSNTVDVYGSNTAYTAATDLYDTNKQGTKIGSVTSTNTITFTEDYTYVGIRSSSGAIYLSQIDIVWETASAAPSHNITATSNNDSYGTVTLEGTTITATPNAGYRVKSGDAGYTVTSGTADVTNNGDNTFSVSPSSDCTITINFEAIPKYTVTWNVNGEVYETTQVTEGIKPTFPATPSSFDATSTTFYGWATATWDGKINDVSAKTIYTSADNMPAEAATYYAVFCEGGGGTVLINESFDNTSNSNASQAFSSSTFPNFSGTTEKAYKSQYGGVKFGSNSAAGYITSKSLDLSTAFTVTLDACKYSTDAGDIEVTVGTQTETISNSSLGEAGTFKTFTLEFDAATSTSTVKIGTSQKRAYIDNVIIATGGGASNFITTCAAGDPCDALQAPNVTATATANSITLSWATVPGATSYTVYNYTTEVLDETTNLTYTFNGLDPETEYEWEVEAVSATCNGKGTNGTTTTSATPCEKLDDATGLTVVTDFVQDGQTYVKFSWTPADNTKNYATNQKLCFGKVDEAGTCVDDLDKNLTWTGDLKSKLEPGEYWWSIQALGDGVNYCDGDVVNGTNFTIEAPTYTVTFNAGSGTCDDESLTETSGGAGVTLPTANPPAACATDGWTFAGWWIEKVSSTNTSPGTLMKAGDTYNPNSDITLYAVYSTQETGDAFTEYAKVTTAPDDWSGKYLLSTEEYTATGAFDSDGTSGHLVRTTYTPGNEEKAEWEFTLAKVGNTGYSILFPDGSWYLGHYDGTNFGRSIYDPVDNAAYLWSPSTNGITNVLATSRKIADNGSADFRPYSTPSSGIVYLYKRIGGGTTTIYNSNPSCEVCENNLTINKGAETNGTFTLSKSGEIETCDGDVVVTVSEISPAEHYSVSAVTATTPTSGEAPPTVTDNGDGTYTITYAANSTGESTINVTFEEDAKATITLSELGVTTTDNTTYYVGETYTLPSSSSQSCDGKQLVGWSRVEVPETDTKPTENYYELGATITLVAEQTFYAVFATANGEGDSGSGYRYIGDETLLTIGKKYIFVSTNTAGNAFALKASDLASTGTGTKGTAVVVTVTSVSEEMLVATENTDLEFEAVEFGEDYTLRVVSDDTKYLYINGSGIGYRDVSRSYYDETGLYGWNNKGDKWYDVYYDASSQKFIQQEDATSRVYAYEKQATTTYTAYTTSCIPTYSITYDFAGGTGSHCSNTSVPQGAPYTICEEEPTKEGHTFQGWSDGTSTYDAGTTITPTKNTTLTAQWQINTYTVIWSNNGATTPVDYNHGDALEVPAAPASCDGVKEFVGWTEDNTFTYHATTPPSDIFTEKTATVTANATYYAVFATKGEGSANFVLGESGTFKMYANVEGTNYYAQGGVSSSKITSTTEAANASDYTLTHKGNNQYTIQLGNAYIGHSGISSTDLNTTETTWTIQEGVNGSWRIVSPVNTSRALAYRASTYKIFKAYSMTSVEAGDTEYYDIEFGGTSSGYSDYTTICQQIESIEVQNPQTEFYLTDDFTIGSGKVIATLSGGGTTDVTALATFSGYNMNVVGTYTVTVTYMGATATYEINVKPLDNAWVLTWNVSGKTNTGAGPIYVQKGSAIGTLPTPVVPDACEGKTFMGWTTSNIVNSDGTGITYITSETVPTDNTTYYAVFATVNNFSVQKPINDITDGSKVVIVAVASLDNTGSTGKAISSRTISITSKGVIGLAGDDVAIFDETINTPHSTCIWTLRKNGETVTFEQGDKYIKATDSGYRKLVLDATADYWTLIPVAGKDKTYHMQSGNTNHFVEWFDHTDSKYDEGERYIGFVPYTEANDNGDFDMQFFVTANANGEADITDYTTGCTEYTITYYGFRGGYSTSTSSDGTIVLPVNSMHTVPNCGDVVKDHTNLGREFLNVWMTQPHGGHTFKPGDTFILTQDTTLYAQWKMETTNDVTTLPTDIEDLAGTDVYVYGGKTLNIQPGTTTINSLTLKGGLQSDGSYKMPIVWVPEGATLVRNSNKIYLDLKVNAKNYYPFAVPFATKNDQYIDYLDPVLNAHSTYDKHFVIKTYNGALRATNGEDRANNWVKVLRHATDKPSYLQPGVGYIIQAVTEAGKDTATIRIPMTVPNTWFENGEQAVVGTTVRNTIAVTAHAGAAATEHQRHAGWNFVASPYLTNFAGGNVENNGGLEYINGELTVNGGWQYGGEEVPYVTIPAYDFSYYTQHKLSDVKLSPEWSFFVQIGKDGTMDFSTAGRQETPASIAARHDAAQSFKMDVDITLSDKNHSDQMGLIISDRFSSAYEVGYDLEKMFGSAYNLTVYTLMEDNTPLAYQALAIHSNMQVIPVGYRVPEQGDYTFALNQSTSSIDLLNEQYEQLILVDYETGALTNLLNSTYTFTSPRTQSDSRFAIYAVIRQKTPTDLPNIDDGDTSTRKILHNGHLYILRDGKVYNGNGQIVK